MPMHDWTNIRAGTYHHFHQRWIAAIGDLLNTGGLPKGYFALAEQRMRGPEPDVVALELTDTSGGRNGEPGGLAVLTTPPRARFVVESDLANYARRADRLTIRLADGEVVAVIEIMSPGNKDSQNAIESFTRKAGEFLQAGIHLLIVDPFPPGRRDPQGIHKAIWDQFEDTDFVLPADKQLTCVSYMVGDRAVAYVEPIAVGDPLPDMPLFLADGQYVPCPLEASYQAAWQVFPAPLKTPLERPHG